MSKSQALEELRKTIDGMLEASAGSDIQRDELEYLLFASRLLVKEGVGCRSRWHMQEDVEMLLRLCRTVLYKRAEQLPRYLRQYYDVAVRALLHVQPKHVEAFLEVVWEATTGKPYAKPAAPMPTLAFYLLDGELHAFLDVPGRLHPAGLSKHYALGADYALERIHEAHKTKTRLTLPTELTRELVRLKPRLAGLVDAASGGSPVPDDGRDYLVVNWQDPLRGLGRSKEDAADPTKRAALAQCVDRLPFVLPEFAPAAKTETRPVVSRQADGK